MRIVQEGNNCPQRRAKACPTKSVLVYVTQNRCCSACAAGIGDVTRGTQRRSANRKSKRDQLGAVAGSGWLAGKLSFCKASFSRRPISDRIFQSPPPAVFRGIPATVAISLVVSALRLARKRS